MKKILIHFVFYIIIAGNIIGELVLVQYRILDYIFKPLIMIWIAGYFLFRSKNIDRKITTLAFWAFLFSWIGDILLMFSNKDFIFFTLGLVSFLVTQIIYINLFLRTINLSGKKPFLKKNPFWLIAYIAYGLVFYMLLYEHLNAVLKLAILIYMVALLGMSVMALNRSGNGHPVSFSFVFTGSVLFVFSDTLIGINKFLVIIPYDGIFIMITYIGAQYLIMKGILKQYE